MKRTIYTNLLLCCFSLSFCLGQPIKSSEQSGSDTVNSDLSQLSSPAEWFFSGETRYDLDVKYAGQKTSGDKLILTAGNCFWDSGIQAKGQKPLANEHDKKFITSDFDYLGNWTKQNQTIRWHIWCEATGNVQAEVFIDVSNSQAGSIIEVSLAGRKIRLKTTSSSKKSSFQFNILKKGKYTLTLKALKVAGKDVGKLKKVELTGTAIKGASVLRARWRPAAVHGRMSSSKVKDSKMWVVQSKSGKGFTSYSPITTPFGYYGTSFDADGRSSTSMNFSMWSYGRGKEEPPIEQLSHLIAVGSPKATFGGFGHEGTGVKLRGDWKPLAAKPEVLTQALRLEGGEVYDTYYGYFLDPETSKWKFFAAGRKWHKPGKGAKNLGSPGSFVEVPGPPTRQRSGDVRREVFIRGGLLTTRANGMVSIPQARAAIKTPTKHGPFLTAAGTQRQWAAWSISTMTINATLQCQPIQRLKLCQCS